MLRNFQVLVIGSALQSALEQSSLFMLLWFGVQKAMARR
jgi:hypothetical protein